MVLGMLTGKLCHAMAFGDAAARIRNCLGSHTTLGCVAMPPLSRLLLTLGSSPIVAAALMLRTDWDAQVSQAALRVKGERETGARVSSSGSSGLNGSNGSFGAVGSAGASTPSSARQLVQAVGVEIASSNSSTKGSAEGRGGGTSSALRYAQLEEDSGVGGGCGAST